MSNARAGRAIAGLGVVLGFIAIWLDFASGGGVSEGYSDDGTVLAFLLLSLAIAAVFLVGGKVGVEEFDAAAAVAGSAVFGFYLLIPASYGFNHLDVLDTGAWLGICSGLIPLGLWYGASADRRPVAPPPPEAAGTAILGRLLCLIAIWLTAEGGVSYWNFVDQGRALPALMLLLILGGAGLGVLTTFGSTSRATAHGFLIVGAVTFGLYEGLLIGDAFGEFGGLDTGSWLGSVGAAILLVGVVRVWSAATAGTPSGRTAVAAAPPAT
jgi:hypothetical protein